MITIRKFAHVLAGLIAGLLLAVAIQSAHAMPTPNTVTNWFTWYYAKYDVCLYTIPVPAQDPLAGLVGVEANALQGIADMKAATLAHPPTGQENDPDYPAKYQSVLDSIEHMRRFAAYNAGH